MRRRSGTALVEATPDTRGHTLTMRNWIGLILGMIVAVAAEAQVVPPQPAKDDPLGRLTPRSTVVNFLREVQQGNLSTATVYLEVRGRAGSPTSEATKDLAQKLQAVLNRSDDIDLSRVSNSTEGTLTDGLPPDEERLGMVSTENGPTDIILHRVTENGTHIWLFSSKTLSAISQVALPPFALDRYIPAFFMRPLIFNLGGWQWIALLVLIPLAFLVARLLSIPVLSIARVITRRVPTDVDDRIVATLPGPLRLSLAVLLFHITTLNLELPLLFRARLATVELIVALTALTWFFLRLIDITFEYGRSALLQNGRIAAIAVIPLARRIVKVLLTSIALLFVLDNLGFDSRSVLAGLGIGGIALALAAQKTLENVFAGVALVLDQPVRVGDFCKFGDTVGTVEDIGLRSIRIRTLDETILSVPNAQFALMNVENFGPRRKILFHPTISVRFDTSPEQLRYLLDRLRQLLKDDDRLHPGVRVSLIHAGTKFDIEIFCYTVTFDYNEFTAIQEDLLLRITELVRDAGTSLAVPVQISYKAEDPKPDSQNTHEKRSAGTSSTG
jgi:MscS family membrane protein